MKCPIDNETLLISDRGGVEIDYCPKCRGVWLDRGELDKIIERAAPPAPAPREERRDPPRNDREDDRYRSGSDDRYRRDDDDRAYKPKRRESFLSDLFDF